VTTSLVNQEEVAVNNVSVSESVGVIGYTLTLTEANGSLLNPPEVDTNYTSIFNPYNNLTYFGQPWIGWYPFTYTNLTAGSVKNMQVNITESDVPGATANLTVSVVDHINATVTRSPSLIDVDFIAASPPYSGPSSIKGMFDLKFNATTGWLDNMSITANIFGVEKIFTYKLLTYAPHTLSFNYSPYIEIAVIVAVAALVVYEVATRKKGRDKEVSKMRKKFTGKP